MTRTLRTFISLAVRSREADDRHVHFHSGPQGQPAACHDARCDIPRLTVQ